LARCRTWEKLAERDDVGIGCFIEPFAPFNELLPEISKMRDGPAEGGQAELQECEKNLGHAPIRKVHERAFAGFMISSPRR
jgi:hypothetical protein